MLTVFDVMEIPAIVTETLAASGVPDTSKVSEILARAEGLRGLSIEDSAALLNAEGSEALGLIYAAAARVKEAVFGSRVVLFAPLYLSNYCSNDCTYCGFRRSNKSASRKALTPPEAAAQADYLVKAGYKRLLLVAGEYPSRWGVDYLVESAQAIYASTDIRILHVNAAPMDIEEFKRLKAAGYGVYQCFQETYHPETYAKVHPSAKKRDYAWRLGAMDRALEAGFGDVGIGALLGLYDYHYDALATIAHSKHLEAAFGAAAHTISVPRLRPADGAELGDAPYPVTDEEFKKVVAVYRLAVPYAGVVVSTREPAALREEVLRIGASQISAGSSTEPGGYGGGERHTEQFSVSDHRDIASMVEVIIKSGYMPSLCTACYRSGRQGDSFLKAINSGALKAICAQNAIISLKEYALDCADGPLREIIDEAVAKAVSELPEPLQAEVNRKLALTVAGERDLHV